MTEYPSKEYSRRNNLWLRDSTQLLARETYIATANAEAASRNSKIVLAVGTLDAFETVIDQVRVKAAKDSTAKGS